MLLFPVLQLTVTYPKATASADGFEFLAPILWVLIALLTGPIGLAIYWVMHRSTWPSA